VRVRFQLNLRQNRFCILDSVLDGKLPRRTRFVAYFVELSRR
jgi:hypothetical protein